MLPISGEDISECLLIANNLAGLDYSSKPVSPLRILKLTEPFDCVLWVLQQIFPSIPEVCLFEAIAVIFIGEQLKIDDQLEKQMRNIPILWMTRGDGDCPDEAAIVRYENYDDKSMKQDLVKWLHKIKMRSAQSSR